MNVVNTNRQTTEEPKAIHIARITKIYKANWSPASCVAVGDGCGCSICGGSGGDDAAASSGGEYVVGHIAPGHVTPATVNVSALFFRKILNV